MNTTPDRLPLREKLVYGFGDLASCLYWQTFMIYLTYFYTDVFGLTAAAAGAMLGLSRSLDAFFDPVMGMVGDRTQTRWGKFRPYLLWLAGPIAVAGVLTFTVPSFGAGGKLVWAWVTYNVLMLLYTAINIPYTAMLGVLTPNPAERTSLSSIKFVGAFLGGMVISFGLLPGVKRLGALGGGSEAHGWQWAFIIIGAVVVGLFLATFLGTRERVSPPLAQKTSVARDLGDLFTNTPWLILLATTITFILYVAARGSVTVHYFKYYVGAQTVSLPAWLPAIGGAQRWEFETIVSWFNGTGQIASLIGVVLLPPFAGRVGKKAAFVSLFLVAIASTATFYVLRPDQLGLIFALNLLGSATGGPLSALIWAMYADAADYSEWKNGRRATGLVFSASIFSQKQGWAIGAWVALALMSSVGFQANVAQSAASLHGLVVLMSLIPAALGLLSVGLIFLYPLNGVKVAQIAAELKERRENA